MPGHVQVCKFSGLFYLVKQEFRLSVPRLRNSDTCQGTTPLQLLFRQLGSDDFKKSLSSRNHSRLRPQTRSTTLKSVLVRLLTTNCPLCPDIPDQCQQTLHLVLQRGSQSERAPNRRPRRLGQRREPDVPPDEHLLPCGVRTPAPSELGDILPPVRGGRVRNDHDVLERRKRGR